MILRAIIVETNSLIKRNSYFWSLVAIFFIYMIVPIGNAYGTSENLRNFIASPTEGSLFIIKSSIIRDPDGMRKEWQTLQHDPKMWDQFLGVVETCNSYAIELAISQVKYTDGGNLEDAFLSIGKCIQSAPELILKLGTQYNLPPTAIKGVLIIFTPNTVDNIDLEIMELDNRIRAINTIGINVLPQEKERALRMLNEYRIELIRVKERTSQSNH